MNKVDLTLYLVTDRTGLTVGQLLDKVDKACEGGVTLVQLREKECSTMEYIQIAEEIHKITRRHNVPLLIDDRIDVALAMGAEGVHLGTDDMPIKTARRILGDKAIIGATAKTIERARQAEADGADYLGTGAIFEPTVKVKTVRTSIPALNEICKSVNIPVCAISGINRGNLEQLSDSPIAGIALIAAIIDAQDTRGEARLLLHDITTKIKSIRASLLPGT
jgi:thiamine-phosphate diphosphorylase